MTKDPRIGKRVRLIQMKDEFTTLQPGDEGTIDFIDDAGTLHVAWDEGSTLGLIPEEDEWEWIDD